ncbi:hypothetical protein HMPREF0766_13474 [Sphingobacterium spiritivorum ATCC 33861]|uniref:Uncharacterized protein n=1 Tax=Sphingobacterium spiritivorum ATCC 33861 TaxID=525373 RepID=D7VR70_SPHSI|nr:hypothetical protein HMPREF0766_13474 [Sphingobacterium spiritivorum ATCC 33861]
MLCCCVVSVLPVEEGLQEQSMWSTDKTRIEGSMFIILIWYKYNINALVWM